MKRAKRSGDTDDGDDRTDIVTRCSNVQRNIFNEAWCKISYHPDTCETVPLPDDQVRIVLSFFGSSSYIVYCLSLSLHISSHTL